MRANIIKFEKMRWAVQASRLIHEHVTAILRKSGKCNVVLTGGRSAQQVYVAWADIPTFKNLAKVNFYFGDERCVPSNHPDSNYGMVVRTLFKNGIPTGCTVFRMEAEDSDTEAAARRYETLLPETIDIILFSVGEDGHIASLFPCSDALREVVRRVVTVIAPQSPHSRLTITPALIVHADSIIVLAQGPIKADVLANALIEPSDADTVPARFVLGATWLLDSELRTDIDN